MLAKLGLLAQIDMAALASYCLAYAELRSAVETLEREGRIIQVPVVKRDRDGQPREVVGHVAKLHPAVQLERSASAMLDTALRAFGMSPAARAAMRIDAALPDDENDPLERFLLNRRDQN